MLLKGRVSVYSRPLAVGAFCPYHLDWLTAPPLAKALLPPSPGAQDSCLVHLCGSSVWPGSSSPREC